MIEINSGKIQTTTTRMIPPEPYHLFSYTDSYLCTSEWYLFIIIIS